MWSVCGEVAPKENVGKTQGRQIHRIGRRPGCPPVQDLVYSWGPEKMARIRHTRKPPRDMGFGVAFGGWLDQNQLLLRPPGGDLRTRFVHEHVDLAAHAEPARQVDPGLDREPDPGHERALVGGDRKSTRLNSSHSQISY